MTDLREPLLAVDEMMMKVKSEWVMDDPESTDLSMYVHVFRRGELVGALQCPTDRDITLKACHIAAVGMSADVLMATFESWHTELVDCPLTGKPWTQGEMAFVGQTVPEALEKGWVTECLLTVAVDRHQNHAMVNRPYVITGKEVEYKEEMVIESDDPKSSVSSEGYIHHNLLQIMSQPTVLELMEKDELVLARMVGDMLDEEHRFFHMDCAAFAALAEQELMVGGMLMADSESTRAKLIEERFGSQE